MFEYGDYGDYRASSTGSGKNGVPFMQQSPRPDNNDGDGLLAVLLLMGLPLGFFLIYFIGCFLVKSYQ